MKFNFELTDQILQKLKQTADVEPVSFTDKNNDAYRRTYLFDDVALEKAHEVSFEVSEGSVIVFFFNAHAHFDNFGTDPSDTSYMDKAINFLVQLFTLPVYHKQFFISKGVYCDKYYFLIDNKKLILSNSVYSLGFLLRPFAKRKTESAVWIFDPILKSFVKTTAPTDGF